MKKYGVYIAGGNQHAGKTTLSLGLVNYFGKNLSRGAGFIKPIGQKSTIVQGDSVGQDSYLLKSALNLVPSLNYLAPFSSGSGVAEQFALGNGEKNIGKVIKDAYKYLLKEYDLVIAEGTGHPGVGSVFGLSNGKVAKLLNTPVILVLDAGIGSTIDRFSLCEAVFDRNGVEILGVVINRLKEEKAQKVKMVLNRWFEEKGIPVLGYLPYKSFITYPSLSVLQKVTKVSALLTNNLGEESLIHGYITAFGQCSEVIEKVRENPHKALVLSMGREDIINTILARSFADNDFKGPQAFILCGKQEVAPWIINACENLKIPLFSSSGSPLDMVNKLEKKIFKVEPNESEKIEQILDIVEENIDFDRIQELIFNREKKISMIEKKGVLKGLMSGASSILKNIFSNK